MARLGSNGFDHSKVKDDDILAEGEYAAKIVESDLTATKAGDGKILLLVFEVIEGPEKGRRHWERLNIQNKNATAQGIAQRALKAICEAVNAPVPLLDSEDLHHKPLRIVLKRAKAQDGFPAKNDLKRTMPYSSRGASADGASGGAKTAQGSGAKADADAMPWD